MFFLVDFKKIRMTAIIIAQLKFVVDNSFGGELNTRGGKYLSSK